MIYLLRLSVHTRARGAPPGAMGNGASTLADVADELASGDVSRFDDDAWDALLSRADASELTPGEIRAALTDSLLREARLRRPENLLTLAVKAVERAEAAIEPDEGDERRGAVCLPRDAGVVLGAIRILARVFPYVACVETGADEPADARALHDATWGDATRAPAASWRTARALVVPAPKGAPKDHPLTRVRVQFLAMLYMRHVQTWSLMREFVREGGLVALSEGFVDENDYLRAQSVDAFMQLTSTELHDWFHEPVLEPAEAVLLEQNRQGLFLQPSGETAGQLPQKPLLIVAAFGHIGTTCCPGLIGRFLFGLVQLVLYLPGHFDGLLEYPKFIEIETVNACNARCPMCTINDWERNYPVMRDNVFNKISDEIILTMLEHHSNIVPWQLMAEEVGASLKVVPIDRDGVLDIDTYSNLLSDKTKFVAVTHVSNALGTILPVTELIRLAHERGAKVLVDGCQSAAHLKIDVKDLDCDFYAISCHKVYGPTGVGILYAKKKWLEILPPYIGGGGMINEVKKNKITYAPLPEKYEAGTMPTAEVVAFNESIKFIQSIGIENIVKHEKELTNYALEKLKKINSVSIVGNPKNKAGVIAFTIKGIHPHDIATILDEDGVAIRAGHHCCQILHDKLGIPASARASLGIYNTKDDLDKLNEGINNCKKIFDLK